MNQPYRNTHVELPPVEYSPTGMGQYDLYPAFPVDEPLLVGYASLAQRLAGEKRIIIEGYNGVLWEDFRQQLDTELHKAGVNAAWCNAADALLSGPEIEQKIAPYLGGDDPLFGKRYPGILEDYFDKTRLKSLKPDNDAEVSIIYGCGASLAGWDGLLVYVDIPKNEIQYRARAGSITCLGASAPEHHKAMYKRFYFVEWIVFNRCKERLASRIDVLVDGQRPEAPVSAEGSVVREALDCMARNYFRVRPWFEPGAWGGQWIKKTVPQLAQDAPNYAWSFELIVPENGIMLSDGQALLELSFDFLMYREGKQVTGEAYARFGHEFPIRFDFLDTVAGGHLSVQCHPKPACIKDEYGETFAQDESYYMLHADPGASVYLGFQDDIDPEKLRRALTESAENGTELAIEEFVQRHPAKRHDYFLIPYGVVHSSGVDGVVLEISSTPYIFTYKMYDWLRPDLDGKPRPLNIERAMHNLDFSCKGPKVQREYICSPYTIQTGDDWTLEHLETHRKHFYDIHRYTFSSRISRKTEGSCQIMNLVEGSCVMMETKNGMRQRFNFAETFVVPAAAGEYTLLNEGSTPAKVIVCFIKDDYSEFSG